MFWREQREEVGESCTVDDPWEELTHCAGERPQEAEGDVSSLYPPPSQEQSPAHPEVMLITPVFLIDNQRDTDGVSLLFTD